MKAIAPELSERYQRAGELLDDLSTSAEIDHNATAMEDIRKRLKARRSTQKGASAGTAGSLYTRGPTPVPSAARSSSSN